MCGIAGIFFDKLCRPVDFSHSIKKISRALQNRGPDGSGHVWIDPNQQTAYESQFISGNDSEPLTQSARASICLIHRRLAILDLSSKAHQPMATPDGRYWITYNGEVFNFKALRKELVNHGFTFISASDTEVVLKAFVQWGPACLERLIGMFAFAVFDTKENILFCARDRVGIKPFYYAQLDDVFIFASNPTAILASGLLSPQPDYANIYHGLSFMGALSPTTVFKHIQALRPGHYFIVREGKVVQDKEYWDLTEGNELQMAQDSKKIENEFERRVKTAVDRTLVSDVEVGAMMSRGLDSTTMVALASEKQSDFKAFTLGWDKTLGHSSEVPLARAFSQSQRISHVTKEIRSDEVFDDFESMVQAWEEPIGSIEALFFIMKEVARSKIKVVLGGTGPDELLCGYQRFLTTHYIWRFFKNATILQKALPSIKRFKLLKSALGIKNIYHLYFFLFSPMPDDRLKDIFNPDLFTPKQKSVDFMTELFNFKSKNFSDPMQAMAYADFKIFIGSHQNNVWDKVPMYFGVEARFPYLDHELAEFMFRVPLKFKIRNFQGKWILRHLAARYLTSSIMRQKKKGFGVPLVGILNHHGLQSSIRDKINDLKKRKIFNKEILQWVIANLQNPGYVQAGLYFAAFETWYGLFFEKRHPVLNDGL